MPSWSPREMDHSLGLVSQSVPQAIKSPGCLDAIGSTIALCWLAQLMVRLPIGFRSSAQSRIGSELFLPANCTLAVGVVGMRSTSGIDHVPISTI